MGQVVGKKGGQDLGARGPRLLQQRWNRLEQDLPHHWVVHVNSLGHRGQRCRPANNNRIRTRWVPFPFILMVSINSAIHTAGREARRERLEDKGGDSEGLRRLHSRLDHPNPLGRPLLTLTVNHVISPRSAHNDAVGSLLVSRLLPLH